MLFMLSYYVSLFSEVRVVMSVAKRCSVRLLLRLFVGGGSCLIYVICVCLSMVVSNTYCVVLLFSCSSFCVPYVASFSEIVLLPLRYSLTVLFNIIY